MEKCAKWYILSLSCLSEFNFIVSKSQSTSVHHTHPLLSFTVWLITYTGLQIYEEFEMFDIINSAAAYRILPCALF
jgi:hypothetical protein